MTIRTHIAGIPHRKPEKLPAVGDVVKLEPEPTNAFDPNAIKVLWRIPQGVPDGTPTHFHLGYIPKTDTETIRFFGLDSMTVVEVMPERKWKEVILEGMSKD